MNNKKGNNEKQTKKTMSLKKVEILEQRLAPSGNASWGSLK